MSTTATQPDHAATPDSAAPKATVTVSGRIDLDSVGAADAKTLMSAEHKALGYRPPPGSLAAEAQAAAAKHPDAHLDVAADALRELAREDAIRIAAERKNGDAPNAVEAHAAIDLDQVGAVEARTIMSAEHKALGYRPPPGSLASEAQAAAAKHPNTNGHIDANVLREAAREDAARIASERDPSAAPTLGTTVDLANVGIADAAEIESAEHKALGYRPPPSSLAAAAKAAAAAHPDASVGVPPAQLHEAAREDAARVRDARGESASGTAPTDLAHVSESDARTLQSAEQKALGYRPPAGSLAAEAQADAAKNPSGGSTSSASKAELVQAAQADAAEVELERRGGVVVESTT